MTRSSSASCPLPTSAISHGAVSPLLWKMLHDVWHVPPPPPVPSQPVHSRMALFLLSCGRCYMMYGTFLLCLLHVPPTAPSKPVQSRIVLFLLSCVSCFMFDTFLFTESCSNDLCGNTEYTGCKSTVLSIGPTSIPWQDFTTIYDKTVPAYLQDQRFNAKSANCGTSLVSYVFGYHPQQTDAKHTNMYNEVSPVGTTM
jgi:hypothetical protein